MADKIKIITITIFKIIGLLFITSVNSLAVKVYNCSFYDKCTKNQNWYIYLPQCAC